MLSQKSSTRKRQRHVMTSSEDALPRLEQVRLPSFHANLWRAIERDWAPFIDPSTPVFLRGYAFGFSAQAVPQLLGVVISLVLQCRRGLSRKYLKRLARRVAFIVRSAAGRHGLAFVFGASLGGSKFLEPRILLLLRWIRRRYTPTSENATANDGRSEPRTRILATYIATLISTWCAFSLQTPASHQGKHAAASDLPLVAFHDAQYSQHPPAATIDPTITFTGKRYDSPTLDFTLFLLVRAVDTSLRAAYSEYNLAKNKIARLVSDKGDVVLFVLSAWRIMFVWFYKPWLLPPEYNQWIHSVARIDPGLLQLLRYASKGEWAYGKMPVTEHARQLGPDLCRGVGVAPELGMPDRIASFPCQAAHGQLGNSASCEVNLLRRWLAAWLQSLALYVPVHFLPVLLFSYRKVLRSPLKTFYRALLGSSRSAAFLATFVTGVWAGVCYGRTRIGPKLIQNQQFWDGGAAMMLGTFLCGFSVLVENKRRRGEMALFVAPRALYAILDDLLPSSLLEGSKSTALLERLVFSSSAATVVTASIYKPEYIRGVVRSVAKFLVQDWSAAVGK